MKAHIKAIQHDEFEGLMRIVKNHRKSVNTL